MRKYTFIFLIACLIIAFFYNNIFCSHNNYYLINSKGEKIEAIFFNYGHNIMFKLNNFEHVVTIMDTMYIGVNEGRPKHLFKNVYYFNDQNLVVNVVQSNFKTQNDTIFFQTIKFYDFKLGEDKEEQFMLIKNTNN